MGGANTGSMGRRERCVHGRRRITTTFPASRPAARSAAIRPAAAPAPAPATTATTAQQKDQHRAHRAQTANEEHEDSPLFRNRRNQPVETPAGRHGRPMPGAGCAERTHMSVKSMRGCIGESTKFSHLGEVFAAGVVNPAAGAWRKEERADSKGRCGLPAAG